MSNRNKGFDPLSSLFEAPDPARGVPLPEVEEGELPDVGGQVEMTDPLFKHPPPPVEAEQQDISFDESPEELARRLAREALAKAGAVSEAAPQRPAEEDKVALAQRLAREALARANAPTGPDAAAPAAAAPAAAAPAAAAPAAAAPAAAADDKQALARRLAQEAMAKAQQAPPAPAGDDKQALARRLAQEALAKAQQAPGAGSAPAQSPSSPGDIGPDLSEAQDKVALARRVAAEAQRQAAAADAAAPQAKKKSRKQAQQSRVSALTERARKPVSALDAARAAARDEEERQAQAIRKEANQLRDVVQELIPEWLPGISAVFVANAIAVDKREVLVALWKGHRSKFLSDGQLERAVGAAAVLSALDQIPEGMLVAAHAVTDASDYLVWLDLDKRALVAAFSDARAYFAG